MNPWCYYHTHTHKANYVRRWICELAWLEYSFHYVHVYQNIMLDTLNIYNKKKNNRVKYTLLNWCVASARKRVHSFHLVRRDQGSSLLCEDKSWFQQNLELASSATSLFILHFGVLSEPLYQKSLSNNQRTNIYWEPIACIRLQLWLIAKVCLTKPEHQGSWDRFGELGGPVNTRRYWSCCVLHALFVLQWSHHRYKDKVILQPTLQWSAWSLPL